jgi:glutamate dehydrogenase/leucine dehydrogenase
MVFYRLGKEGRIGGLGVYMDGVGRVCSSFVKEMIEAGLETVVCSWG